MGILLTVNFLSAFAVSSAYYEGNPLLISPGEEKTVDVVLQNMAGSEEIVVAAKIVEGENIARVVGFEDSYSVPVGERRKVSLKIDIPEEFRIGDETDVILSFSTVSDSESGTFGFGSGIESVIPVKIIASSGVEEKQVWLPFIIVLAVIALVLIIFFIIKKVRKG